MKDQHQIILILTIILGMAIISAGCTQQPVGPESGETPTPETTAPAVTTPIPTTTAPAVITPAAGIPNPAAVYCASLNNTYEIRTAPDGSQYGVCILPGGTVCDEWEYFRGNCTVPAATGGAITDPAENFCLSRFFIYQTRTDVNGTEESYCIFPSGKECEATDYYLGRCDETTAQMP